ncbi:MAG: prolyl oligopeptidase family serine peptidase [Pirellulales bacterium]|nr:prolyl oligopeptidase family serine peptidase [Pirellulales bacterium]
MMQRRLTRRDRAGWLLAGVLVSGVLLGWDLPVAAAQEETTGHVTRSYDGQAFDYKMKWAFETDQYRVYRVTYPSPVKTPFERNNTIPADYYLPRGVEPGGPEPKRPAVICLHILDGNFELVRMVCSTLASHGVPAVMFKLPYYGERGPDEGPRAMLDDPKLFLGALTQGMADVRRTVDWLASRPEIDSKQIGITGISLGGLVAASASAQEKRINRVALILAGGDLPHIIATAREATDIRRFMAELPADQRAEAEKAIREVDPLSHAPALRDRARQGRVLMFCATDDRVIPKSCAEKLAAALDMPADKVVWLHGLGHYTALAALPQIMDQTAAFFAQDLPPGAEVPKPAPAAATPSQTVARLLGQLGTMLGVKPKPGRCHLADLKIDVTLPDGKTIDADLRLIQGAGSKFRLELNLKKPWKVDVALGQGDAPWMARGGKAAFVGSRRPSGKPPVDPETLLDPAVRMKIRMAAGGLAGVAMAPMLLDDLASFSREKTDDDRPAVRITVKKRARGSALLVLKPDGQRPDRLTFDIDGTKGEVVFRGWEVDAVAHASLFAPPDDVPVTPVDEADIHRMFSALLTFGLEKIR